MAYIENSKIDLAIAWFTNYIISKQPQQHVDFYNGYMQQQEGYKYEIFQSAHEALRLNTWTEDLIGSHFILNCVIEGLNAKSKKNFNNIVDFHAITQLRNKAEQDINTSEEILFRLFTSDDVGTAFEDACTFFGRWYPTFSYLLFMRDCEKYLPVKNSKENHYDRFAKLGISTACLYPCTWKNYQVFLSIHKEIQQKLAQCFEKVTLLDAHSFVWTLWAAPPDLSFSAERADKVDGGSEYLAEIQDSLDNRAYSVCKSREIEDELSMIPVPGQEKEAIVKIRVNQDKFRLRLLRRYKKCCLCGVANEHFLTASHIKPWADSTPEEKLDINNGLLFCPNHDKLFDKGWITFSDEGAILISKQLDEREQLFMNVTPQMKIPLRDANKKYMVYHREHIFIDCK